MKRLLPTSSEYQVPSPKNRDNEFEVQAWLLTKLREHGINARAEVKWRDKATRQTCRFDLVIYDGDKAVEIVETKWGAVEHINGVEATRQGIRYRKFGVPVVFVYGLDDARTYLNEKIEGLNGRS